MLLEGRLDAWEIVVDAGDWDTTFSSACLPYLGIVDDRSWP